MLSSEQHDTHSDSAGPVQSCNDDVHVSGARHFGIPSRTDAHRLFSPSFSQVVEEGLPLTSNSELVPFGGQWFWELYQHSVLREHVFVFLGGTGINLEEDSLESQKRVRAQSFRALQTDARLSTAWGHGSVKLEVLYALGLSIALRVVREPMLHDNQGPQAVVLCATKDQCDEMTFVLNRFCTDLHLVVHNLFEPYPAMPVGKLAEVVVATPPLWESVSSLPTKGSPPAKVRLEDILAGLFPKTVPPTYSATRVRPYSLQRVVELALFAVDQQCQLGFASLLGSITQRASAACRVTRVYERSQMDISATGLSIRCGRHPGQQETAVLTCASASNNPRKRDRDEESGDDCTGPGTSGDGESLASGLLLWNALSASRLLLEHDTFREFHAGVEAEALRFWESFEGKSVSSDDFAEFVDIQLLLMCHACPTGKAPAYLSDVCLSVLPTPKGLAACASRLTLLFAHLEDRLSGTLFDRSVVTCTNLSARERALQRSVVMATGETSVHSSVTLLRDNLRETAGIPTRIAVETLDGAAPVETTETASPRRSEAAALLTQASALFIADSSAAPFPHGFFLPDESPAEAFTIVVVRGLATSRDALCTPGALGDSKPAVLTFLEECCQYGRVLSYYCHESTEGSASLFIEFETEASAAESVRLLSYRFAQPGAASGARVRLFRNATYYEGVGQAEQKHADALAESPTSDLFDDLMEMDLLSE